jgi:hypothetical protein
MIKFISRIYYKLKLKNVNNIENCNEKFREFLLIVDKMPNDKELIKEAFRIAGNIDGVCDWRYVMKKKHGLVYEGYDEVDKNCIDDEKLIKEAFNLIGSELVRVAEDFFDSDGVVLDKYLFKKAAIIYVLKKMIKNDSLYFDKLKDKQLFIEAFKAIDCISKNVDDSDFSVSKIMMVEDGYDIDYILSNLFEIAGKEARNSLFVLVGVIMLEMANNTNFYEKDEKLFEDLLELIFTCEIVDNNNTLFKTIIEKASLNCLILYKIVSFVLKSKVINKFDKDEILITLINKLPLDFFCFKNVISEILFFASSEVFDGDTRFKVLKYAIERMINGGIPIKDIVYLLTTLIGDGYSSIFSYYKAKLLVFIAEITGDDKLFKEAIKMSRKVEVYYKPEILSYIIERMPNDVELFKEILRVVKDMKKEEGYNINHSNLVRHYLWKKCEKCANEASFAVR